MDNHSGKMGEDYAADLLLKKGYQILHRNYHSRFGEIDLIAQNEQYLVFLEVKTRNNHSPIHPLEFITPKKQEKILKTAAQYLAEYQSELQPRFDALALVTDAKGTQILSEEYLENVFA